MKLSMKKTFNEIVEDEAENNFGNSRIESELKEENEADQDEEDEDFSNEKKDLVPHETKEH